MNREQPPATRDLPPVGEGTVGTAPLDGVGQRLRTARESKRVDIARASADLRIPIAILEALEREDHAALPPRIYALGLLRNYARYLSIDAAVAMAGWSAPVAQTVASPSPLAARTRASLKLPEWRTALRSPMGLLRSGGVGLLAVAIVLFLGAQAIRFATPPGLEVAAPTAEVTTLREDERSATISGRSAAGARIRLSVSGGATVSTQADADGHWSIDLPLARGRNEVEIRADDPATGSASGETIRRVLVVPMPATLGPTLEVSAPVEGATITDAPVALAVRSEVGQSIRVEASNAAGVTRNAEIVAGVGGLAEGEILLPAGTWTITFRATGENGVSSSAAAQAVVAYSGVYIVAQGGSVSTWIRSWADGVIDPVIGATGKTIGAGDRLVLRAERVLELRIGNPPAVSLSLNGVPLAPLGREATAGTWSFSADGTVAPSTRR